VGKQNKGKTEANTGKNRGTTAYLPHGRQKNRLESPLTTVAPPSEGRKPSGTEIESSRDREKEEEQKQKKKHKQPQETYRGTTAYLPRRHHKNRLKSLSTTAAPPSEGRKPFETEIESSRDREGRRAEIEEK
jgi:hypothetical protein